MGADPLRQGLRPARLGVGIAGGTQHSDEHLGSANLAGQRVDHIDRSAGIIDEHLVASDVGLPHRRLLPPQPIPVMVTVTAVTKAIGRSGFVFLPQQCQGHIPTAELLVNQEAVRLGAAIRGGRLYGWEQPTFQSMVRQIIWQRPGQLAGPRPPDGVTHS